MTQTLFGSFFMEPIGTPPKRQGWQDYRTYGRPTLVPMEKPVEAEKTEIKLEETKISKNIEKYDRKIARVKRAKPYDYNSLALDAPVERVATADETVMDPTYNLVGKFLGVDTRSDWSKYSDKVQTIVKWAKEKSGAKDLQALVNWISGAANIAPSFGMNHKKIDQLFLYAKLQLSK